MTVKPSEIDRSKRGQVTYFEKEEEIEAFHRTFSRVAAQLLKETRDKFILPKNVHRFHHGGDWTSPANPEASNTGVQQHSVELTAHFDDLIGGDLDQISRTFKEVTDGLSRQFAQMMYSTVSEVADKSGNVVNAKDLGIPEAFIAMMEKVDFSADKNGNIRLPEIHVGRDGADRILKTLEAQPQEFRDRVEAIKAKKREEALTREAERKAKFVNYGG
jgi:hypothetical protein